MIDEQLNLRLLLIFVADRDPLIPDLAVSPFQRSQALLEQNRHLAALFDRLLAIFVPHPYPALVQKLIHEYLSFSGTDHLKPHQFLPAVHRDQVILLVIKPESLQTQVHFIGPNRGRTWLTALENHSIFRHTSDSRQHAPRLEVPSVPLAETCSKRDRPARLRCYTDEYLRLSTPATHNGFDEASLVARAKAGDANAFSELVRHYDRRVFRMAKQITQNDDDAEDVLQEAFLKAYTHLDDFQGNSKFYTWIVRIAVNEALMKLRKRRSDRSVPLDEPIDTGEDEVAREIAVWDENPEETYSREELAELLDEAIQSLKPAYRTVFILRDIEELSIEETAEALGLSISAVKSRLLRARLQLREKLTRQFKRKGDDAFAYL